MEEEVRQTSQQNNKYCLKCINEQIISALQEDCKKNSIEHKEVFDRLREIELQSRDFTKDIGNLTAMLGRIEATVNLLAAKPAKRWESVIASLISAAVGALFAYIVYGSQ